MTRRQSIGRRNVLQATGTVALTGVLAGCLLGGDLLDERELSDNEPESIESWLSNASGYDGTIEDRTAKESVTVIVGPPPKYTFEPTLTPGNETPQENHTNDQDTFEPAAIKISPETPVTWKWIGSPDDRSWTNLHNVVATDEQFDSGEPQPSGTYKHTFESAGKQYYFCRPHKENGMKGVVVVADST